MKLSVARCLSGVTPRRSRGLWVGCLVFVGIANAQPAPVSESTAQVFVHDSTEVASKLALADRMARLHQWDTAADTLQQIIEKDSDRVVATQNGLDGKPTQYIGAGLFAEKRLSTWPEEGLAVYRGKFESGADAALKTAGDNPIALHQVLDRYFVTTAGKTAGIRLVDISLNAGEFSAAAWTADRLLTLYPNLDADRPAVLLRAGLAAHLQGRDEQADGYLKELQTKFPNSVGTVDGKDMVLAAALANWMKVSRPGSFESNEIWPTFGGDQSRNRLTPGQFLPHSAPLISIPLSKATEIRTRGAPTPEDDLRVRQQRDQGAGMRLDVIPVVDGNVLYYQDGAKLCARNLDTGLAPIGWNDYSAGTPAMPIGASLTVTLTPESIFTVMGQRRGFDPGVGGLGGFMGGMYRGAARREPATRLVCVDRSTGRPRWIVGPHDLPDQASLRFLAFSSSPLVVGRNVYVLGRGGKGGQFNDCYVLCFERTSGQLVWASYIASSNTNAFGFGQFGGPTNDLSHLSYSGGRIFVQTNVGAVASIDADTGNILWLDVYPRKGPGNEGQPMVPFAMGGGVPQATPWTYNAPLIEGGNVFVLPTDSSALLVYDAFSGRLVQQMNLADFDQPNVLLAADGDQVIFAGDLKLWCVNWRMYDAAKYAAGDQSCIFWRQDFLDVSPIRGRSFVTSRIVYVPTGDRLYEIDRRTGKLLDTYPSQTQSAWNDAAGNVLSVGDKLIIAGGNRIDIYVDPTAVMTELRQEEQANPNDAEPLLRHAAILFSNGDMAGAIAKLDQAQANAGADKHEIRQRIFALAMRWIDQLRLRNSANDAQEMASVFDRAAAAADTAEQKANYRIIRADYARDHGDIAGQVELVQDILLDPAERGVQIVRDDGRALRAGELARRSIVALLQGGDASAYAPFEQQAAQAFQKTHGNASQLLEVAEEYPNSSIRGEALRESADAYLAAGDAAQAAVVYHHLLLAAPANVDQSKIPESIARAQLLIPNQLSSAIAWLRRAGNQRIDSPLKLPDGQLIQDVTCNQAADQLETIYQRQHQQSLPDFNLHSSPNPFEESSPITTTVDALIVPDNLTGPADRVIGWSGDAGLRFFRVADSKQIAQNSEIQSRPFAADEVGDKLLIADPKHVLLLRGDTAQTVWRFDLNSAPILSAVDEQDELQLIQGGRPELGESVPMRVAPNMVIFRGGVMRVGPGGWPLPGNDEQAVSTESKISAMRLIGDRAILMTTDGRLMAVNVKDGSLAWQVCLSTGPLDRLETNSFFAVVRMIESSSLASVVVVDLFDGQVVSRIASNWGVSPVNMVLSDDDRLIFTLPDQVCRVNLDDPSLMPINLQTGNGGLPRYGGMTDENQLLIAGDKIVGVSDEGSLIRINKVDGGNTAATLLGTGAPAMSSVKLASDGSHVYAISPTSLAACDVDDNTDNQWTVPLGMTLSDVLIGRDDLVFHGQRGQVLIYSRQSTEHGESGRLEYAFTLGGAGEIQEWQATDDGLCYLGGDRVLHILHGR